MSADLEIARAELETAQHDYDIALNCPFLIKLRMEIDTKARRLNFEMFKMQNINGFQNKLETIH